MSGRSLPLKCSRRAFVHRLARRDPSRPRRQGQQPAPFPSRSGGWLCCVGRSAALGSPPWCAAATPKPCLQLDAPRPSDPRSRCVRPCRCVTVVRRSGTVEEVTTPVRPGMGVRLRVCTQRSPDDLFVDDLPGGAFRVTDGVADGGPGAQGRSAWQRHAGGRHPHSGLVARRTGILRRPRQVLRMRHRNGHPAGRGGSSSALEAPRRGERRRTAGTGGEPV